MCLTILYPKLKMKTMLWEIIPTYIFALHCQIHVQVCCFVQGNMYMMPIVKYKFINENIIHDLLSFFLSQMILILAKDTSYIKNLFNC